MRVYGIISYIYASGRTVLGNASFSSGPVLTSPSGWSMINYTKAEFNPGIKSKNHTVSRWQETRQLLPILMESSSSCVRQQSPLFLPACTAHPIASQEHRDVKHPSIAVNYEITNKVRGYAAHSMCCSLTLCVGHPIWGVFRSSYTHESAGSKSLIVYIASWWSYNRCKSSCRSRGTF